jgi:hypothetical protein
VSNWIQYRNSFRDVVDIRPILATHGADSALALVHLRRDD